MFGLKKKPLSADEKKKLIKQQQERGRAANRAGQLAMQTAVRNINRPRPPGR